jgi:hypothetical protein
MNKPLLVGTITETSYVLPEHTSQREWEQIVATLARMERCVAWWLGDALNFGERKFGEAAWDIQSKLLPNIKQMEYGTLADLKWVAKSVPAGRRNKHLSWSHHRQIAKLPAGQQIEWLNKASEGEIPWTRGKLREEMRTAGLLPAKLEEDPLLEIKQRIERLSLAQIQELMQWMGLLVKSA